MRGISLDARNRFQSIPRVSEKSAERFLWHKYMTRVGFMSRPACTLVNSCWLELLSNDDGMESLLTKIWPFHLQQAQARVDSGTKFSPGLFVAP